MREYLVDRAIPSVVGVLFCVLLTSWGCSSSGSQNDRAADAAADGSCTPGRVRSCPCEGDAQGRQTCSESRRLGECECPDGGAPLPSDAGDGGSKPPPDTASAGEETGTTDDVDSGGDVPSPDASDAPRLGAPHHLAESEFEFDQTLNAVEDLGMDPSGQTPIDAQLDEARAAHTLIEFPPGTYKIAAGPERDATHKWGADNGDPAEHFGIKGLGDKPSDVQFVVEDQPANYGGRWLSDAGGEGLLLKNFSIQMSRDQYTSADMVLRKDDLLLVEEVEWLGVVPSDDHGNNRLLTATIERQSGVGELNRVYMRTGAIMPGYPDGMSGVVVGAGHAGTIYLTDLWIENMSSSAVAFRAQNLSGRVGVEGGFFKNNANNNIRGCAGEHPDGSSYIRDATIVIDSDDMSDSQPSGEPLTSTDALTINGPRPGYSGLVIEDVDIYHLDTPGGLVLNRPDWARHGRFTLRDVRIRDETSARLFDIRDPDLEVDDQTARFENVHVTGAGSGALWAEPSTTAEIVDSCVESNFDIENFDEVSNVSRSGCSGPQAPKAPPPR